MIAPAAQRRRGLAVHGGVLALMTALALAYTWPLPAHLGTRYAVRVPPNTARTLGPGAHPLHFQVTPLDDTSAAVAEKSTFVIPR